MPIGKPALKQEAIKLGAEFVGKLSLAATFQVLPTGKTIVGKELPFVPSPLEFRPYKIVKGIKVPLRDVWIERRARRLEVRGREVQLIQMAKGMGFGAKRTKRVKKQRGNMFFQ